MYSTPTSVVPPGWFEAQGCNQAMRFGKDLPPWLQPLIARVQGVTQIPSVFRQRSPMFDQAIFNMYRTGRCCLLACHRTNSAASLDVVELIACHVCACVCGGDPGEGIKPHVDLAKFDDGIAGISLQAPCVMSACLHVVFCAACCVDCYPLT